MFIQHADTAHKYQEDAHIKRYPFDFSFKKPEKKIKKKTTSYKTENKIFIQQVLTTRTQHEIYTRRKTQPKAGVLGADLEALRYYPC